MQAGLLLVQSRRDSHWVALQRVLQYLKEAMSVDIKYTEYPSVLEGFSDAKWTSDPDQ